MKKNISQTVQEAIGEKKREAKAFPAIRIPTQRPVPQLNHHIKRETQQVTKEWTAEVSHTDQVTSHFPPTSEAAPDLAPKRIQRFHQKKTVSLLKKMVELHAAASKKVDRKVKVVAETNAQQKLEQNQDELWRDMIKPHEERQFQIGRITNFFS